MLSQAQALLCTAAEQRQTYPDERCEAWQQSVHAQELLTKLERLQETMAPREDCASLCLPWRARRHTFLTLSADAITTKLIVHENGGV